jgi:VanZ family protein
MRRRSARDDTRRKRGVTVVKTRPLSHPDVPLRDNVFNDQIWGIRFHMARRKLAGLLWLALLCWACGILVLSSLTPQELPEAAFLLWDKANHFLAYALGGWLAASALRVSRAATRIAVGTVLAVIGIAAFGALDELFQTVTPGRTGGDIFDWTADLLGAIAGALISLLTHGRLERLLRSS